MSYRKLSPEGVLTQAWHAVPLDCKVKGHGGHPASRDGRYKFNGEFNDNDDAVLLR